MPDSVFRDSHVDPHRLLDLALGLCNATEAAAIEDHVVDCERCEALLRERVGAVERGRARSGGTLGGRRFPSWRWVAAAAVILLCLLPLLPGRGPSPYWIPVESHGALRSTDGNFVSAGLSSYAAHDLPAALRSLEAARASGQLDRMGTILLASCYQLDGQPERAAEILDEVDWLLIPEPWRDYARYVYVLVLQDTGRDDEAQEVLEELPAEFRH
jgi:tetratricopeptide (TPR) repeat protein